MKHTSQTDFTQNVRQLKSTDPRKYWKLINIRQVSQVQATLEDLYEHFKELSDNSAQVDNVDRHAGDAQQGFDSTDLDKPFDEAEIKTVAQKLTASKSPGTDIILNEYIKASLDQLMPVYVYLFNRVLDTGDISDTWLIRRIVPYYKGKGLGNRES